MGVLDDLFNSYRQQRPYSSTPLQEQLNNLNQQQAHLNNLLNQLGQQNPFLGQSGGTGALGGLGKIQGAGLAAALKPPKPDPKVRIAEINAELDIIRGIVPTPKGYKVDPRKVKALMTELGELEKDLT